MQIQLVPMTRELCHALYKDWENDPAIYMDMTLFHSYKYDLLTKVHSWWTLRTECSRTAHTVRHSVKPSQLG